MRGAAAEGAAGKEVGMSFDVLGDINYLAVIVAAVAFFAWSAIYYAPPVTGRAWQRAVGLTQEQARPNPAILVASYVAYFLMALTLAAIARSTGASTVGDGLVLGLFIGIGIVAAGIYNGGLYEQKLPLAWINIGNALIGFLIVGVIVTVWD
jgi:Protein of unknown function (DUF1761)